MDQIKELVAAWLRDYKPAGCPAKDCGSCRERQRRQSELLVAVGLPPLYACEKCRHETTASTVDNRCPACGVGRIKPVDPIKETV